MNIKYVSLLSLLVVAGAQAMSPGKKVETTKNSLKQCQDLQKKSWRSINCDEQAQTYQNAKEEFVNLLRDIAAEGRDAASELNRANKSILFGISKKKQQELRNKKLDAYAASVIHESLTLRNFEKYEWPQYDDKPLEEYCSNVLGEGLARQHTTQSTWATDVMGNYIDATDDELKEAKSRMMNTIKEMSQ